MVLRTQTSLLGNSRNVIFVNISGDVHTKDMTQLNQIQRMNGDLSRVKCGVTVTAAANLKFYTNA